MVKVLFKFDKGKDLYNHWNKVNHPPRWGANFFLSPKIQNICKNKTFDQCKSKLLDHFYLLYKSKIISLNLRLVEEAWKNIEKEFFTRMDKLMKKKFDEDIIAYLTTLQICPYNPKEPSFMFSLYYSLPKTLQTCGHEIMHLYFHKYYWKDIENKIGEEMTANLKESLTVLLNHEFKDLWFIQDKGYEVHKKLRDFISREWKKEPDFDVLIDKCIEYLK